ncbi:solute carrier family 12 member 8 isoform X1 [Halyomorpha halys]|uniref:solute carrier family 12 member 8 isoform X1 n=1 Tax=Halyomorpha halys TaxID=286706 RepID=UPI0006D508D0|nr:solute carrier family 12 member 8 isoform X1 [Halyomorpha halys]XP_014285991.1 solute carrier family 12 member 8 isoform X1 [Halyomorpha halys]
MGTNGRRNESRNREWLMNGFSQESTPDTIIENGNFGFIGHQPAGPNELFAGEQNDTPWWKSQFFISEPVLFGTLDGVFTSCLINVFGVIVFLRSGWIVGQAGVLNAILMIMATVGVALITVLSAVGICERCRMESGGVYFLLAHVLGPRLGTAFGLLYVFGQAVGCSLFVLGFGESLAGLVGLEGGKWAQRGFASAAVLLLAVINLAGVKWVVKLQFMLLVVLLLAALDLLVGSFVHTDIKSGFTGWWSGQLSTNLFPDYFDGYNWFTVFGVFFPTITGILAGINMSGDLRNPAKDIPNGTLGAVITVTGLYLTFVLVLGSTCTREALKTDFMISAKVSAVQVLLLSGLYVSSMSSCLGAMYGTPRVLQSIANENVIPHIQFLGKGRGPNKVPVYALVVVAVVTISFILDGDINSLAPIVTMPFLMMYSIIDYAYFALAQTFDIQSQREQRFKSKERQLSESSPSLQQSDISNDLDTLFPERSQHRMYSAVSNTPSPEHVSTAPPSYTVHKKTTNWYSKWCNRWLSLFGAFLKLGMMLLVHWGYALANIGVVYIIWLYVGLTNPAVKPGIASEFKFFAWLHRAFLRLCGRRGYDYEEIVVPPSHPGVSLSPCQLTEENEDFSSRQRFHQTATVRPLYDHDAQTNQTNIQILVSRETET